MRPLLAALCLSACQPSLFTDCSDLVKAEVESPDGKYAATVFERDCGATTGLTTNLSLRAARRPFDPRAVPVLIVAGQSKVTVEWTSEDRLTVNVQEGTIFREDDVWREVHIHYR